MKSKKLSMLLLWSMLFCVGVFAQSTCPSTDFRILDISPVSLSCNKLNISLTGQVRSNIITYEWTTNDGYIISGADDLFPNIGSEGTYYLTVLGRNGCVGIDSVRVNADPLRPDLTITTSSNSFNCNTSQIQLTGTSSSSIVNYQWSTADGNLVGGTSSSTAVIDRPGTYILIITTAEGCVSSQQVTIGMEEAPQAIISNSEEGFGCNTVMFRLDGSASTGAATYQWSTTNGTILSGANTAMPVITSAGIYTLVVQSSSGCTNSSTITIGQDTNVPAILVNENIIIYPCERFEAVLDASQSTNAFSYQWTALGGGNILTSTNTSTITVDQAGIYQLTATSSSGCTTQEDVVVTANNDAPTAIIEAPTTLTCETTVIQLNAINSANASSYSWTTTNGTILSGGNTPTPTISGVGIYTLTVSASSGCTATTTVEVIQDATAPQISISNPLAINCDQQIVQIDASNSTGGATYRWTTSNGLILAGENNPIIGVGLPGVYNLVVTNSIGCTASQSVTVQDAKTNYFETIDFAICEGESVTVRGKTYTTSGLFTETLPSANGCDTILTINVFVSRNITTNQTIDLCSGEVFTINGNTYNQNGNFSEVFRGVTNTGCDSIVNFNVRVTERIVENQTIDLCPGESYSINGRTYTQSGNYTETFTGGGAGGCDRVVNLTIRVIENAVENQTIDLCPGESYSINGRTYTQSGTYTETFTGGGTGGCDRVVNFTIRVIENAPENQTIDLCSGESYSINGRTYTQAGSYTETFAGVGTGGCDRVVNFTIRVTENVVENQTIDLCSGESYSINGKTYTQAGSYTETFVGGGNGGCDRVVNFTIRVTANVVENQTIDLCSGESYNINGRTYTQAGSYSETFTGVGNGGCDRVVNFTIRVTENVVENQTIDLCSGESYSINGRTYTQSGNYTETFVGSGNGGCDRVVNFTIRVIDNAAENQTIDLCSGASYSINGRSYTQAGTYTETFIGGGNGGCDRVVNFTIRIIENVVENQTIDLCSGESYSINGRTYTQAGTYTETFIGGGNSGCDRIVNFTIRTLERPIVNQTIQLCGGESYVINGRAYDQSGTYTEIIPTSSCDSIVNFEITTFLPSESDVQRFICGTTPITINGVDFDTPGTYDILLENAATSGCDSLVHLTISPSVSEVILVAPEDITVNCDRNALFPQLTILNIEEVTDIRETSTPMSQDGCTTIIRRGWVVTDACGRQLTAQHTITRIDETKPIIQPLQDTMLTECGMENFLIPPTVLDNCDEDVGLRMEETTTIIDSCTYQVERRWVAEDACGNSDFVNRTITVKDLTGPIITFKTTGFDSYANGDTLRFACGDAPVLDRYTAMVMDNCDPNPQLLFIENIINYNACSVLMYCGWRGIDACGNSNEIGFYFHITDEAPPIFDEFPADITVDHLADAPAAEVLHATDNCTQHVHVVFEETIDETDCFDRIVRSWTAVDDCGYEDRYFQYISAPKGHTTSECTGVKLRVRAGLQGAMTNASDLMRDDLRVNGLIPTQEPYSNHVKFTTINNGSSTTTAKVLVTEGEDAIVDWILLELRDATYKVIATRSALLQRDGDIVDVDGISPVSFDVSEGNYYIAIRHRNHLGAMSSRPYLLTEDAADIIDFCSTDFSTYGEHAQTLTSIGYVLRAGNTNANNTLIFSGISNDRDPIFFDILNNPNNTGAVYNYILNGYHQCDTNMDGQVIYQGNKNDIDQAIFFNILLHPDNVNQYMHFIVEEQLPRE